MPEVARDEIISHIVEELNSRSSTSDLPGEWGRRYPDLVAEAIRLLEAERAIHNAAVNWKSAAAADTVTASNTSTDVDSGAPRDANATVTHPAAVVGPIQTSIPERIGRYRVLRPVGQGGMGVVYEAEDPELRRRIAVKMPHFTGSASRRADARQRFVRESRAAAAIQHANVCPIHDVGVEEGKPFVVMSFIEGQSLAIRLMDGPYEDAREAAALVARMADALASIHAAGIIHRDLKPGNILLRAKDGEPVITDFGLARIENDREHATAAGAIMGTAAYMAPEQACSDLGPITLQSDLYSLGVVLFEMITAHLPFEGNMLQVIHQTATRAAPRASQFRHGLDPALDAIIARAMARAPRDRFPDAAAFRDALEDWLGSASAAGRASAATKSSKPRGTSVPRRSLWWAAPVALLLAGAVAAAVVVYLKHGSEKDGAIEFKLADADADAKVFIDDEEQPRLSNEPLVQLKLKPGKHRISIRRGGRELFAKEFEVKPGETFQWGAYQEPPAPAGSPLDLLDPAKIPESERFPWQPKELVAVIGSHAWNGWGVPFWRKTANGDQLLAAAHVGDELVVSDPETGKEFRRFELKNATDSYVSSDGETVGLFAVDPNGMGWNWSLWRLENRKPIATLRGNVDWQGDTSHFAQPPVAIAVSADARHAVTVQATVSDVWDLSNGKSTATIRTQFPAEPANLPEWGVSFLPDSVHAVWVRSSEVVCYDVVKGEERARFQPPPRTMSQATWCSSMLAVSPDGKTVALPLAKWTVDANKTHKYDCYAAFWNWEDRKVREVHIPQIWGNYTAQTVYQFQMSPDWKNLVLNNQVYDPETGKASEPNVLNGRQFAFSPDGKRAAGWAGGRRLRYSQLEAPVAACELALGQWRPGPSSWHFLALAPDNKTIATRNTYEPSPRVYVRDAAADKETFRVTIDAVYAAFSPDGGLLATSARDRGAQLWNARTGESIPRFALDAYTHAHAAFSPDSQLLAFAGIGHRCRVWTAPDWKNAFSKQVELPAGVPIFSPDGKTLAVSWGSDLYFHDSKTGAKTGEHNFSRQLTAGARHAYVGTGKLLVYGGIAYDIAQNKELYSVAPESTLFALAGPDGNSFFTYGANPATPEWRGIRQWSIQDGKKLKEWPLPFNVHHAEMTSDGRYLITSNDNGTVYILRLDRGKGRPQ